MSASHYKAIVNRLDHELAKAEDILKCKCDLCINDVIKIYYLSKTIVKLGKAEDIITNLWETGHLSGHPYLSETHDHDKAHPAHPAAAIK